MSDGVVALQLVEVLPGWVAMPATAAASPTALPAAFGWVHADVLEFDGGDAGG